MEDDLVIGVLRAMVTEAVAVCTDTELLDLVYKLLIQG